MKIKLFGGIVLGSASVLLYLFCTSSPTSPVLPAKVEVYFSPDGGAQDAIVERIEGAERAIDVAMYALTNREIAWA
ncbi:MAG TPA: phospholipase D family protein, partial [Candidatus Latescibacteria bacterium]|nr:phospholipase D family protein [Candidatus Latescibacterota bacterium]